MAATEPKILTSKETTAESKLRADISDTPALKDFSDKPVRKSDKSDKKSEARTIVPFYEMFKSIPEKSQSIISQNFQHVFTADNHLLYLTLDCDQLANRMETGEIVEVMDMREYLKLQNKIAKFAGEVYLVCIENTNEVGGKEYCKAVFKPRDPGAMEGPYAEIAAFQASRFLSKYTGKHLVPPTILKEYCGRIGSLQWYVESSLDLWKEKDFSRAYQDLNPEDLANGAAFVHVLGQWDTHPGNQIMPYNAAGALQLALIDNEGICNFKYSRSMMERPFVRIAYQEKASSISTKHHTIQTLKTPTLEALTEAFKIFDFDEPRLKNLHEFLSCRGKQDMDYMIHKNFLWVQYHRYNSAAFPNHVKTYPRSIDTAYFALDMNALKRIFELGCKACPDRFNDKFFKDILARRDQLLKFIRKPEARPAIRKRSSSISKPKKFT